MKKAFISKSLGLLISTMMFLCGCSQSASDNIITETNTTTSVSRTTIDTANETTTEETEKTTIPEKISVISEEDSITTLLSEEKISISENSSFSIHFIDVGQADAALIECDSHYMLIDGGNKEDASVIYSVLKQAEVPKLDIVVATHAHEDHVGGLAGALNYTTADIVLSPVTEYDSKAFNDFKKYADLNGNGIVVPHIDDVYSLGSSEVKILGVNGAEDTNNTSIVLKVIYGETSFLFTGDAEREAEQVILNNNPDLSSTLLKVGHHGSDTSTTYPFLREIMPKYAIISVGAGNSYNHPTDDTLSRLRDADCIVYRTDLNGDIYAYSDGYTVTIETDKKATTEEIFTAGKNISTSAPETTISETSAEAIITEMQTEALPTESIDYVVNTNTKKFHYPNCSSVKKIKDSNRMDYTGSRDDLISQGYVPCKNCNP